MLHADEFTVSPVGRPCLRSLNQSGHWGGGDPHVWNILPILPVVPSLGQPHLIRKYNFIHDTKYIRFKYVNIVSFLKRACCKDAHLWMYSKTFAFRCGKYVYHVHLWQIGDIRIHYIYWSWSFVPVLSVDADPVDPDDPSVKLCGINYCAYDNHTSSNNATSNVISDQQRYTLSGIYLGCALLSSVIVVALVDPLAKWVLCSIIATVIITAITNWWPSTAVMAKWLA